MSREVSGAQSQTTASAAEPAGAVVEGGAVIAKRVPWSSFSAQRAWLGGPVSLAALALVVAAALASGTSAGGPVIMIERLSGASTTLPAQIDSGLPVGYAFGARMVAGRQPMRIRLAACLSRSVPGVGEPAGGWTAIPRALAVSEVVTLSFVFLFGTVGLVLSSVSSAVAIYFPWAGLAVGVVLVLAAGRILGLLTTAAAGFKVGVLAPVRAISRYVNPVSGVLLPLTGAYVVYYWLTLGGLIEVLPR